MKKFRFSFMKAAQICLSALLVIPYLSSCGNSEDPPPKSALKEMTNVRIVAGTSEFVPQKQSDGKTWKDLVDFSILESNPDLLKSATVTFTLSEGATSNPASGATINLDTPQNIVVTAEDGSPFTYIIELQKGTSNETDIIAFSITVEGMGIDCIVDKPNAKVTIPLLPGADLTAVTPSIILSLGATASPLPSVPQNFTVPVKYTVTAHDKTTTREWTVTRLSSDETEITAFSLTLGDKVFEGEIDEENSKITVSVEHAYMSLLVNAVPTIVLSPGATSNPASGVGWNFSNPVMVTVTAHDGTTTQPWTVETKIGLPPAVQIMGRNISESDSYGDDPSQWIWKQYGHTATTIAAEQLTQLCRWRGEVFSYGIPTNVFKNIHDQRVWTSGDKTFWNIYPTNMDNYINGTNSSATSPATSVANVLSPIYFMIDMGRSASYTRLKVWNRYYSANIYSWFPYEFEIWGSNSEPKPVSGTPEGIKADLNYWTSWKDQAKGLDGTDQWKNEGWERLCICKTVLPSGRENVMAIAYATSNVNYNAQDTPFLSAGVDFNVDETMQEKPFRYLRFVILKQNYLNSDRTSAETNVLNMVQFSKIDFWGRYAD